MKRLKNLRLEKGYTQIKMQMLTGCRADKIPRAFRLKRTVLVVQYDKIQPCSPESLHNAGAAQLKKC